MFIRYCFVGMFVLVFVDLNTSNSGRWIWNTRCWLQRHLHSCRAWSCWLDRSTTRLAACTMRMSSKACAYCAPSSAAAFPQRANAPINPPFQRESFSASIGDRLRYDRWTNERSIYPMCVFFLFNICWNKIIIFFYNKNGLKLWTFNRSFFQKF